MRRVTFTIAAFLLCLAVVVGAMSWVTLTALRLEKGRELARRRAALEEKVRLALWRTDSALTPLIARESVRPYFVYTAFYPAERSYTRMFAQIRRGEVLLPSPLLTEESPYILLHFQIGPDGRMTSPESPTGNMRDLAEAAYVAPDRIDAASLKLAALHGMLRREDVLSTLPAESAVRQTLRAQPAAVLEAVAQKEGPVQQMARNYIEIHARFNTNFDNNALVQNTRNLPPEVFGQTGPSQWDASEIARDSAQGVLSPVWVNDSLFLMRRVTVGGGEYIQGCWLDWPALRHWLLGSIRDLLPNADLTPVVPGKGGEQSRMLTALPIRLIPGEVHFTPSARMSPISVSLIMAWICAVVAAVAVAVLLFGALSLSERRGAFVSAVTHELRTPLTTFRMYTEMLAEKMIAEPKRQRYLGTLRAEADRLSHLVENVLSFSQLENRRHRARLENLSVHDAIERARDRLNDRAEQAGMRLMIEEKESLRDVRVRADAGVLERVLFNLVDNACKYASAGEDKRLHIETAVSDGRVEIRVRDHGPGVSLKEVRRLFRPFRKSARDAANSAPGVGLGLALCRGLARSVGGRLFLDHAVADGACFVLSLPRG